MLRLVFVCVLFLPISASCQPVQGVGLASPDPLPSSPSAESTCLGHQPTRALSCANVPDRTSFNPSVCLQEQQTVDLRLRHGSEPADASSNLPDAPSAVSISSNRNGGIRDLGDTRFVPPTLVIEPHTNKRWHTLDRRFVLLHTLSTLVLIADAESTAHMLEEHPKARELNPIFGKRPTRARIYSIALPLNAFVIYQSYRAKKVAPRRTVWTLGPKLSIATHTIATLTNLLQTYH
jgi:hypothetical protein